MTNDQMMQDWLFTFDPQTTRKKSEDVTLDTGMNTDNMQHVQAKTVVIPAPVMIALHLLLSQFGPQLVSLAKSLATAQIAKLNLSPAAAQAVTTVVNDVIDGIATALGITLK